MTNQVYLFDKISNQTLYKGEAKIDLSCNEGLLVSFNHATHPLEWRIWKKRIGNS